MEHRTVLVPGARRVEATLDAPTDPTALVVACPPHPQFGGNRHDSKLEAVRDFLAEQGVATLRFDYGPWDEGLGEREDVRNALRWGNANYDRVGLFGYSFGGAMAAFAASSVDVDLCGVSLLAPAAQVAEDFDAEAVFSAIDAPVQVVYGSRDETADWEPLVEAARATDATVLAIEGDHFFVGQLEKVAAAVGEYLVSRC